MDTCHAVQRIQLFVFDLTLHASVDAHTASHHQAIPLGLDDTGGLVLLTCV